MQPADNLEAAGLRPARRLEILAPVAWASQLLDRFADVVEGVAGRSTRRYRVVVVDQGTDMALYGCDRDKLTSLGSLVSHDAGTLQRALRRSSGAVELRLQNAQFVRSNFAVPKAAAAYLDDVIRHRLERLTPWKPDKVRYGFAVTSSPDTAGSLSIDFAAIALDTVTEKMERLGRQGLQVTSLGSAADPLSRPPAIDLLRHLRHRSDSVFRRRIKFGAAVTLTTAIAVFGLSVWFQARETAALHDAQRALAGARQALQAGTGGPDARNLDIALLDAKRPENAMFVVLDRLAAVVPSNTFLTALEVRADGMRLSGVSSQASALIEILEDQPAFHTVKFSAPVVREVDGRDRFDLTLERSSPAGATP